MSEVNLGAPAGLWSSSGQACHSWTAGLYTPKPGHPLVSAYCSACLSFIMPLQVVGVPWHCCSLPPWQLMHVDCAEVGLTELQVSNIC